MTGGAYGARLGDAMGLAAAPTISAQLAQTAEFAATWLKWDERPEPAHIEIQRDDSFLLMVLREPLLPNPYWVDGRPVAQETRQRGQFNLLDLHRDHVAEVRAAVDCISLYLPRPALDVLAQEQRIARVFTLKGDPGKALEDPVVWHIAESLRSALERPNEVSPLFIEHLGMALGWHMIGHWGEHTPFSGQRLGGLAPWQERRARDILMANIAGRVTTLELADACSLSRSHFARAFKTTTGLAPHRWLLLERIREAKRLLESSAQPVAQIAESCGFADQSHLTRTFYRVVHATPARWRSDRRL